jgi:hypothetical protein
MATKMTPLNTRAEQPLHDKVEAWRRRQPKIPPRSEALRELLRRALQAEERGVAKEHTA